MTAPRDRLVPLKALVAPDTAVALLIVVAGFTIWSASDGGYEEILWYPIGLVLLVLLCVLAWSVGDRPLGTWSKVAVVSLAAYVVWAYLSIIWAEDGGLALTGANRTLVYLLVFVVVIRRRWRGGDALVLALAWAVATLVCGLGSLVAASRTGPGSRFVDGRLSSPVAYANANAALFVLAFLPLLIASQERRLSVAARAAALGGAIAAAELALLSQSKGAALGTAATVVALVALLRSRARILLNILIVSGLIALVHGPLFRIYNTLQAGHDARTAIRHATVALGLSVLLGAACGAAVAVADARLGTRAPRELESAGRALVGVSVLASIAVVIALTWSLGGPTSAVHKGWRAFTEPVGSDTASHFTSTSGNHRYDFWRVAAHQFDRSPLLGAGIDNFGTDYVRERHSTEEPLYPHSLEARLLGETGLVGFGFFLIFVVAAFVVVIRASRSLTLLAPVGAIALGMLVYWLAHGSVDWLWEFPGLTGPVFALVACTASVEAPAATATLRWPNRPLVAKLASAAAAAILLVPSWLAARDVATAIATWRREPANAASLLSAAAKLDPLSDQPYVVAGTIAERRRAWRTVERDFRDALSRNEQNWYSHLELGIALAKEGRPRLALATLLRAHQLDPRETLVTDVLGEVRAKRPIDVTELDRLIIGRTSLHTAA